MAIIKSKIKLTIPEGLTQKGDITIDDAKKTAKVTVTGKTLGNHTVSVQYDSGAAKTCQIAVTAVPAFSGDPTVNPTAVEVGGEVTVTQAFTVDGIQVSEVTIKPSAGLIAKGAASISGKVLTAKFTAKTPGAQTVTLGFKETEKVANVTVNALPVFNGEPTVSKAAIEIGEDVIITQKFDKAGVSLDAVTITPSAGLTEKTPAAISGSTLTVTYTGKTAGVQTVEIEYNGNSKTANVTVNAAMTLQSVTAQPESVTQGQDSTITMQFA